MVLGHGKIFYPESSREIITWLTFDGVSIFFVLSGFLIGSILLTILNDPNQKSSLWNFWTRRWLRTLPNYFLILFILLILSVAFKENFVLWTKMPYLYFGQNLISHKHFFFSEAWSLSVEEWFYFLVPAILFALVRLVKIPVRQAVILISVLVILSVTLFRLYRYYDFPVDTFNKWDNNFRRQVFTRLDSIMFGVLAAAFKFYAIEWWNKYKNLFALIGISMLLVHQTLENILLHDFGMYRCVFSFTLNSAGVFFVLPFLSTVKSGTGIIFKSITYISLISYSMYLVHYSLVNQWIVSRLPWESVSQTTVAIAQPVLYWFLTLFLSLILYAYIELPFMKLRDRKSKNN